MYVVIKLPWRFLNPQVPMLLFFVCSMFLWGVFFVWGKGPSANIGCGYRFHLKSNSGYVFKAPGES